MSDPTLVLDFGSGFVKAGFAGQDAPSIVFPTVIGKVRHTKAAGSTQTGSLIGENALSSSEVTLRYPIERQTITNWNDFYSISDFIFQNLQIKPENVNILVSKPLGNFSEQLEKMTEYYLETQRALSVTYISSATLSLLSTGRVTGIVAECGSGVTNIIPVFESFGLEHARITSNLGGQDVDAFLRIMLKKIGMMENDNTAVNEVKEQLCYVRESSDAPILEDVSYELPSGTLLKIGQERYLGPEVLFDPKLNEVSGTGLSDSLTTSLNRCDVYLQKDLLENVIISGGSTMFPGISLRVQNDLNRQLKAQSRVIAAPERKFAAWVGGSIFGSTPVFEQFQIKKVDWDTQRDTVFRQKSFM